MAIEDFLSSLPGLGAAAAAATLPAQVRNQSLTTRGLLPGETGTLSPQLLAMLQGAFGQSTRNLAKPSALPPLDELGLYSGQRVGFDEAVKQATSQISGNMAGRGFIRPENAGAIAGSAAQQVMPQFAPLIGENMRQSVLAPEQIDQNRFANLLNAINSGTQALGQKSTEEGYYPSFATMLGQSALEGGGAGTAGSLLGPSLQSLLGLAPDVLRMLGSGATSAVSGVSDFISNLFSSDPNAFQPADSTYFGFDDPNYFGSEWDWGA